MNPTIKYNLILTPSFLTNSIILKGLIEFLSQYFNVYFIDLPGFTRTVPPLKKVTLEGYAEYIEQEIKRLNLEKYILGSISFGHCLVSKVNADSRCVAVLSIEPFVNSTSLLIKKNKLTVYKFAVRLIKKFNLYGLVWNEKIWSLFLKFRDDNILRTILREYDPRTFIDTAYLIFTYCGTCWCNKPHILIANKNDNRISYEKTLDLFKKNVSELQVIDEEIDHFPQNISKQYFESHISLESVNKILGWINAKY